MDDDATLAAMLEQYGNPTDAFKFAPRNPMHDLEGLPDIDWAAQRQGVYAAQPPMDRFLDAHDRNMKQWLIKSLMTAPLGVRAGGHGTSYNHISEYLRMMNEPPPPPSSAPPSSLPLSFAKPPPRTALQEMIARAEETSAQRARPSESPLPLGEWPTQAAVRVGDRTFTGNSHFDAMQAAEAELGPQVWTQASKKQIASGGLDDGYITNLGNYVPRHVGGRMLDELNQTRHYRTWRGEDKKGKDNLLSEALELYNPKTGREKP